MSKKHINERVLAAIAAILDKKVATKTSLAKAFGISTSKFSEILSQRMMAGTDILAILTAQYEVSAEWLLIGKGETFGHPHPDIQVVGAGSNNTNAHHITVTAPPPHPDDHITLALLDQLREKDRQLSEKDAQINNLVQIITAQEQQIRHILCVDVQRQAPGRPYKMGDPQIMKAADIIADFNK